MTATAVLGEKLVVVILVCLRVTTGCVETAGITERVYCVETGHN
jgi:hypothetical protein